ncbi:hypothetical protein PHLGIDRAFT_408710 [Phlebiopsis gigantea 11061_1 CR5-6]|uniref:Uncharacterized protein n=1 Tax=Phlebiopsis gigantea (strain 11061_1 CR5-6) TaxID=745531 RepID=A0A0C3PMD2_PHLG1|nr:hypothetical protein PHLGIDRAFT_408710 [Phlebiopsis gigantea 11061_1 CR5-6]
MHHAATPPARAGLVIGGYPIFTVPLELQKLAALVMHIIDEPGWDDDTCIQAPDGHCNFEIVQLTTGARSARLTIMKGVGNAQVEAHVSGGHIIALRLRPCRCNYPQATELPGTGALRHGYWSAVDTLAADISQAALSSQSMSTRAWATVRDWSKPGRCPVCAGSGGRTT